MTKEEGNFARIIQRALEGEHTKFILLKSTYDLTRAKECKKAIKAVIKILTRIQNSLPKNINMYLAKGMTDEDIFNMTCDITSAYTFYQEELKIVKNIISEFRSYVRWGHFANIILFGFERPEEDMVDWRTTKIVF